MKKTTVVLSAVLGVLLSLPVAYGDAASADGVGAKDGSPEKGAKEAATSDNVPSPPKWPRDIVVSNAVITVYQPQLESIDKNRIKSVEAVAVKRKNSDTTDYCAVWTTAKILIDKEARTVSVTDLKVDKVAYPGVSDKVKKSLGRLIRKYMLKANLTMSLDRFIAMMVALEHKEEEASNSKIKNPVPKFFFSTEPAVLVLIDGEPVMRSQGDGVSLVANTPYMLAFDGDTKAYYLRCAGRWFKSSELTNDWTVAETVPEKVGKLLSKSDEKEVAEGAPPRIFVSTEPAELIQSDGPPELATIPETNLSYLKNSDSDVFRSESTGKLYLLVSGRWYVADAKEGPWSYIDSKNLPADFRKIPESSPKGGVLASISGTEEAADAVAESYIPQTAKLKREPVDLGVEYDGEPKFEPLTPTTLQYAVNSNTPVVKSGEKYYACSQGAWYESDTPLDPWIVCVKVPEEIYSIPPDSPLYNTTFVKVYDYDEENNVVDVGYTSGYLGSYAYGGHIVFGTGYWYPFARLAFAHWVYWHRPHIQPICTFGAVYRYNRYWGCWNRYARYRAANGRYVAWRRATAAKALSTRPPMGPGNYIGRQPRTSPRNAYSYNKAAVATAMVKRGISRENAAKLAAAKARKAAISKHRPNNVYVGKDGHVYRHTLNGWEKRSGKSWDRVGAKRPASKPTTRPATRPTTRPATRPTTRPGGSYDYNKALNNYLKSRQRGSYRSSRYKSSHYSRSRARPSYRRSSFSRRGGGRRR